MKGVTPGQGCSAASADDFNPRSREGSDLDAQGNRLDPSKFQSTLPRRERRAAPLLSSTIRRFQSTLPRRERLSTTPLLHPSLGISIHAPAKGATQARQSMGKADTISIHAPAKGATRPGASVRAQKQIFQSTLPRRERRATAHLLSGLTVISIHAPAKGATTKSSG